jgi:hypothetical protein
MARLVKSILLYRLYLHAGCYVKKKQVSAEIPHICIFKWREMS